MTISEINESISKAIEGLDEVTWIPQEEIYSLRTQLENVQESLDNLSDAYGDEADFPDDDDETDPEY